MRKLVIVFALVLMASSAQAATLDVVGGQLMGASNVLVDGSYYDVQFGDGTCIDLYNGCDDVSDFTFQTEASGLIASQALLDQVFLDGPLGMFDSSPILTNGCDVSFGCILITPTHSVDGFASTVNTVYSNNVSNQFVDDVDRIGFGFFSGPSVSLNLPLSSFSSAAFAVWQPVPEPNTALLLSLGLTGLAAKGRRSLRS